MLKVGRKRKRKERKRKSTSLYCLDLSFALLHQLLASLAWNFTTQPRNGSISEYYYDLDIVTFQNIFSSMADFRDVVSVAMLPAARLIKASRIFWLWKKLMDREKSRSLSWLFDCHRSRARNIKKRLIVSWFAPKKGAIFSLIFFFTSFCIYYIPHNYVTPQAMPHAIPQTHSAFYPHRMKFDSGTVDRSMTWF